MVQCDHHFSWDASVGWSIYELKIENRQIVIETFKEKETMKSIYQASVVLNATEEPLTVELIDSLMFEANISGSFKVRNNLSLLNSCQTCQTRWT